MSLADILSLFAIYAIWIMMIICVILSVGGFIYYQKAQKDGGRIPLKEYPMVSVLVPAHNEGIVIEKTVQALLNFDYPKDKYEIIVINDNSTDDTAEKLKKMQEAFPDRQLIVVNTDAVSGGNGKSNALNIGFSVSKGSVLAIYDADNTPETGALTILVEQLMADDKLAAVIGKYKTRNRNMSLLTRFVNIETLAQQCMNQAGRYFFFKLCTIPGTNYVIRRSIITQIGGWDTKALSEDTEISFRIYRMGYFIKQMPTAVTWEQEPHLLNVWFRQRTRWSKGNIYVMLKNFKYTFDPHAGRMRFDILCFTATYVIMVLSLIISDVIFVLGLMGYVHVTLGGFSTLLWGMAILIFVINIMVTLASEKGEFSLESVFLVLLMLFTYSKLWVVVSLNAVRLCIGDALFGRKVTWDKTVRFEETDKEEMVPDEMDVYRKKKLQRKKEANK